MQIQNKVFLAVSIDGFIADKNHKVDWLDMVPNPNKLDLGYHRFIEGVDALLMGKNTFDFINAYDGPWPYTKPVFVLSNSLKSIPTRLKEKVSLLNGNIEEALRKMHLSGHRRIYVDGGKLVQSFMVKDKIDELTLTTIPIILGEGIPLFDVLPHRLSFELVDSRVHLGQLVQSHYRRKRE